MRDDFNKDTKLALAHRANLVCSNPDCGATTGGPQEDPTKALNIGVAAHITAAAPGGERYDDSLTAEERGSSDNGIWLCQNCAKLVDNDPVAYPAELLRAWKVIREHNAVRDIGKTAQRVHETEGQRKAKEILKWKDKPVMHTKMVTGHDAVVWGSNRPWSPTQVTVADVNEFYVLIRGAGWERSIAMGKLNIGWSPTQKCIEIQEYD